MPYCFHFGGYSNHVLRLFPAENVKSLGTLFETRCSPNLLKELKKIKNQLNAHNHEQRFRQIISKNFPPTWVFIKQHFET